MTSRPSRPALRPFLRAAGCAAVLALLSACASQGPQISAPLQAALYKAHAAGNYVPPGPPEDPWGPYIQEAAGRFDVPDAWIRALMHVESGGQEYQNGQLITSNAGAMGLMQVMPGTYEELRGRYGLGGDPFDPHDNIIAGVAYMRELYDIYGAPAFLAAYNGGPARLDDYLADLRPLPEETRHYVAMIGPALEGVEPHRLSPAEAYAMNDIPLDIAPGLRYGGGATVMLASAHHERHGWERHFVARRGMTKHQIMLARREESRAARRGGVTRVALLLPPPEPPRHGGGFHLIDRAEASPAVYHTNGAGWAVQVGAFTSASQAQHAVGAAKADAHHTLGTAHPTVASVHERHGLLWRARLTGLSREAAVKTCAKLAHGHSRCLVVSPAAQS